MSNGSFADCTWMREICRVIDRGLLAVPIYDCIEPYQRYSRKSRLRPLTLQAYEGLGDKHFGLVFVFQSLSEHFGVQSPQEAQTKALTKGCRTLAIHCNRTICECKL